MAKIKLTGESPRRGIIEDCLSRHFIQHCVNVRLWSNVCWPIAIGCPSR
jgi:hypothetical protein